MLPNDEPVNNDELARIRVVFERGEMTVRLFDNPASRDLLAQLPLSLDFSDYAGDEKVAYPPRPLTTRGVPKAGSAASDFTYYAPWGNIAIFYRGYGSAVGLYALGRIESGKEHLAAVNRNFAATMERSD